MALGQWPTAFSGFLMKLIVGLGNPGLEYDKTRHNAGFVVVDRVAEKHPPVGSAGDFNCSAKARFQGLALETTIGAGGGVGGGGEKVLLLKPTTYMNRSGRSVAEALNFYKLDPAADLLVIVDDTALACGQIRLRASGSAGGHNGLADIQRALGADAYPRLRVGVDPKPAYMDLADYVLGRFTPEQELALRPAIARGVEAVECFVREGITTAMNRFNAVDPPSSRAAAG